MPFAVLARAADIADAPGAVEGQTDSGARGDLVLQFVTRHDSKVRPEHAALHGRIYELDDPHAPSPPLAYGCRCEIAIVPRARAEKKENETPAQSIKDFPAFAKNLEEYGYPEDVIAAFKSGDIKPADLILPSGDRISTAQARAIIASGGGRAATAALTAVAKLDDRGISGVTLWSIVNAAKSSIAKGQTPAAAALGAIEATERRGYVTARTAVAAAKELVATGLLK